MERLPQLDLELRGIRKRYGGFTAVDDVSLQVGKGQFVCLLGPSGCGKTTTLALRRRAGRARRWRHPDRRARR